MTNFDPAHIWYCYILAGNNSAVYQRSTKSRPEFTSREVYTGVVMAVGSDVEVYRLVTVFFMVDNFDGLGLNMKCEPSLVYGQFRT